MTTVKLLAPNGMEASWAPDKFVVVIKPRHYVGDREQTLSYVEISDDDGSKPQVGVLKIVWCGRDKKRKLKVRLEGIDFVEETGEEAAS